MSTHPISISDIGKEYDHSVTTQDYTPKKRIEGVQILDLRLMIDDGGSFAELVHWNEDGSLREFPQFFPRQASFSEVIPGAIKAFHLHFNQEDVWFVPPGDRLLIGLHDVRKDSTSYGATMRFVAGAGKAQLVFIPRGVAHGCANTGNEKAHIIYFVNQQFNLQEPDERRLPWDVLGADFWEVTKG